MALELTASVLRYLEAVTLNPGAQNAETPPLPESCFVAAVAEATAFTSEAAMSPANLAAVNESGQTVKALTAEAEALPDFKAPTPVVLGSTTPSSKKALPVTISVLGEAWQQLTVAPADRTMTLDLIRAAETETAYNAAGILPPPAHADTLNSAAIAVEGVPAPAPNFAPRTTTTRVVSADHISALVKAHILMADILRDIGINIDVPNATPKA